MDRKFGIYILLGLVIGVLFGVFLGSATGNTILGIGPVALGGVFVGWFAAAAALKNRNGKEDEETRK